MKVTIGVSNHHVHLTEDDFKILFGSAQSLGFVKDLNQPKFRAAQLFKWLHSGVCNFDDMTNLPASFREILKEKKMIILLMIMYLLHQMNIK